MTRAKKQKAKKTLAEVHAAVSKGHVAMFWWFHRTGRTRTSLANAVDYAQSSISALVQWAGGSTEIFSPKTALSVRLQKECGVDVSLWDAPATEAEIAKCVKAAASSRAA